jgi:hypothetical protein
VCHAFHNVIYYTAGVTALLVVLQLLGLLVLVLLILAQYIADAVLSVLAASGVLYTCMCALAKVAHSTASSD